MGVNDRTKKGTRKEIGMERGREKRKKKKRVQGKKLNGIKEKCRKMRTAEKHSPLTNPKYVMIKRTYYQH